MMQIFEFETCFMGKLIVSLEVKAVVKIQL